MIAQILYYIIAEISISICTLYHCTYVSSPEQEQKIFKSLVSS